MWPLDRTSRGWKRPGWMPPVLWSVLCVLDQKCLCILHRPSAASSSAAVAPPGLNASGNAVTPAGPPSRFFIGLSLTLGFTLMFVVDQIGGYLTSHGMFGRPSFCHADCHLHICISNWSVITGRVSSVGITATLGLVIHAAGTESQPIKLFFFFFCLFLLSCYSSLLQVTWVVV